MVHVPHPTHCGQAWLFAQVEGVHFKFAVNLSLDLTEIIEDAWENQGPVLQLTIPTTLSSKAIENLASIEVEVLAFSFDKDWRSLAPDISRLPTEPGWPDPPHVYHLLLSTVDPLQSLQERRGCDVGDHV